MKTSVTFLILSLLPLFCSSVPVDRPTNWLRQCRASTDLPILALEVLPGGGWDNLRNMDMGRVMNLSYTLCQTTEDGLYLIPDEVFVIPQKQTGVETSSEIISSWLEQKSSTSNSINLDISYLPMLNAKFSTENMRMKTHQVKDSSVTARVQVRNFMYTVKAYPDFTLDVRFIQQVKEIANAIENNQTKHADYLSEKMVLDFGTHVITNVDAGAILVQEDYLSSSYVSDSTTQSFSVKALAGFNFFQNLKFDIGFNHTEQSSSLQGYQSNIQYSLIQSHGGGVPFYPGITLQKWQESTKNNLVAIDRSGFPLHYIINPNTIPDLPQASVKSASLSLSQAIERYYKINTRPGCIDVNSQNFNFQANVDDKSCEGAATNFTFGGVYQQCTKITSNADPICDALTQKNIDTGKFSCRFPYFQTLLRSEIKHESFTIQQCYEREYRCGFLWLQTCYDRWCHEDSQVRSARIDTYWCAVNGTAPANSGFLFGGLYSSSSVNPITKAKSCPPNFISLKFLSDNHVFCVSNDYETGTRYAVPFGGLFSCQAGNPLARSERICPHMFSQHLAAVSDGCEILYCVRSGLFTGGQLKPIRLPPFSNSPPRSMLVTNTVLVMTEGENNWMKVGKAWKIADPKEIKKIIQNIDPALNQMTGGQKAGVAFGVIGLMVVVLVVVIVVKKRRRHSNVPGVGHYERIGEEGEREPLQGGD